MSRTYKIIIFCVLAVLAGFVSTGIYRETETRKQEKQKNEEFAAELGKNPVEDEKSIAEQYLKKVIEQAQVNGRNQIISEIAARMTNEETKCQVINIDNKVQLKNVACLIEQPQEQPK